MGEIECWRDGSNFKKQEDCGLVKQHLLIPKTEEAKWSQSIVDCNDNHVSGRIGEQECMIWYD